MPWGALGGVSKCVGGIFQKAATRKTHFIIYEVYSQKNKRVSLWHSLVFYQYGGYEELYNSIRVCED